MSKPMTPIEGSHKTLAAQVNERIREAILKQTLKPGVRIDQMQLARDLNVSLVPVREALKSLEVEGLVHIVPRRGAFVTEISLNDLDDLYFARKVIEGELIYHAVPHLKEQDYVDLQALNVEMRAATDAGDVAGFMDRNRQFHMRIYEALDNSHLLGVVNQLWERSELYRYRYMFILRNASTIHAEHDAILSACRAGDRPRARELAINHIGSTQEGLHQQLKAEFTQEGTSDDGARDRLEILQRPVRNTRHARGVRG